MFKFIINPIKSDDTPTEVFHKPAHFQQSVFWTKFKSLHEWKNFRFLVVPRFDMTAVGKEPDKSSSTVIIQQFELNVLVRTFKRFFSLAYIPMGPDCGEGLSRRVNIVLCAELAEALKSFLPRNTICVRMDPPMDFTNLEERILFIREIKTIAKKNHLHISKPASDIQPPDTTILDLSKTSDGILSGMKPKWRYNVRLAEKKGVVVSACHFGENGFDKALDAFYELFETTSKRDGIAIHKKEYIRSLFELSRKTDFLSEILVTLYLARHEEDTLAGIVTLFTRDEAVYLYGASSNIKRNLMPTYLIQWQALNDAKIFGSEYYDFYGMSPNDDPHHPLYGLYRFKTGFGGQTFHRLGSIDVPLSCFYRFYTIVENMRAFYHKRIKKLLAGR